MKIRKIIIVFKNIFFQLNFILFQVTKYFI